MRINIALVLIAPFIAITAAMNGLLPVLPLMIGLSMLATTAHVLAGLHHAKA